MSIAGTREHFENFYSKYVAFRNVDVWFPPGYEHRDDRYPVLYMHDGQNILTIRLPLAERAGGSIRP